MIDQREAALTFAQIRELHRDPVQGQFDVAHLGEVHRRIFQDLPERRPGEFRPDAPGHFKNRGLEAANETILIPYALRPETDRMLGPTLDALQGGKSLRGYDMLEMSEAFAQTYARLDYLHPFHEGNSRTLRTFTEQLARENGHQLDWGTTNVTPQSRDALYIARDVAVMQVRNPGLTREDVLAEQNPDEYRLKVKVLGQLNQYRLADPLQEIVRKSLEHGRDPQAYDRRMSVVEAVREISVVGPIALNQAERNVETTRLAVLRRQAPSSDQDRATNMRDWVVREGSMDARSERLERVAGGHITIRHEPGATALERLTSVADGISLELTKQRTMPSPTISPPTITPPTRSVSRDDLER